MRYYLVLHHRFTAKSKKWYYADENLDNDLINVLKTNSNAYYAPGAPLKYPFYEMVAFKKTIDGVLKYPRMIGYADGYRISGTLSAGVEFDGSFVRNVHGIAISYKDGDYLGAVAVDLSARLYYIDENEWKVERPTEALMTKYAEEGYKFIFLATDEDGDGVDIIIRVEK